MPRASRYLLEGYTYHLTQRCTNREFFLRFAKDRDVYREWLRIGVQRHHVPLYGHCVTNTHVHLIVHVDDIGPVAMLMDLVAGVTAQQYNRRKGRSGAFWEPYQCTIIEDGRHLFNCLRYVDLNMVRAGVVAHPREWRWCGWSELMGRRTRYRLLDIDRLMASLDVRDVDAFRDSYGVSVDRAIQEGELQREPMWTESLAVGSQGFVTEAAGDLQNRYEFEYEEVASSEGGGTWTVRDVKNPYMPVTG